MEIEAALARDIPVVPVLVQGTEMPSLEELPESLEAFGHRNAVELSDARWSYDVGRLIAWLKTAEEEKARREQAERERAEREAAERKAAEQAEHDRLDKEAEGRAERQALERAERERQEEEAARRAEAKREAAERREREAAEVAERERYEREAAAKAETAERERLEHEREEREAEERAERERERVAAERAAVAQRALGLTGSEAARREELKRKRERGKGAAVEQAEAERLEKVASEQAERLRPEKEAGEPARRWIRLPRLKPRYWIAIAAVFAGVAALGAFLAVRLGGEEPTAAVAEGPFPNQAEQELLSHIPADVRGTCSRGSSDSEEEAAATCNMPNVDNLVGYALVPNTETEADSLFGSLCFGEPRPWKHGEVCEDHDPTEGASLYWIDNRFSISGSITYSGVSARELRDEWRCCLQLQPAN